jgi:hypothetical protein
MGGDANSAVSISLQCFSQGRIPRSRINSEGGLILVREFDEGLGFGEFVEQHLTDARRQKNMQVPLCDLLQQSVYRRLAGCEDLNIAFSGGQVYVIGQAGGRLSKFRHGRFIQSEL